MTRPVLLITTAGAFSLFTLSAGCHGGKDKVDDSGGPQGMAPTLTLDKPVQDGAYTGAVQVSGFAADFEDAGDLLTMTFSDSVDGDVGTVQVAADGTFDTTVDLTGGGHTFTATVTDTDGQSASTNVVISVTLSDDIAPVIDALTFDPADPHTGDTLLAVATTSDADGDEVTMSYAWTESTTGATAEGESITDIERGQIWTVVATANDGVLDSEPMTATVEVTNSPPHADAVVVNPAAGTVDDTFVCEAQEVVDPEGDTFTVSYRWSIDGVEIATGDTLTPELAAGLVTKHANLVCEAILDDGDQNIVSSETVDVQNRAPDAPTVVIAPEAPGSSDDLTCSATSADTDGDVITYTYVWWVDGVDSGYTDATLPASATERDQIWTCSVTADDGDGGVSTGESTVTIDAAFSGTGAASDADVTIDGQSASGSFSKTIALVGDTDGDGLSELLVGASAESTGRGTMYLFDGASLSGAMTTRDAIATWTATESYAYLGGYRDITSPGDLDGDGFNELLFAAAQVNGNGDDSGEAYLYYGGASWSGAQSLSSADWTITGSVNDQVGARLSTGDYDGDGIGDIVVAAPGASDSNRESGTVAIFLGTGSRWTGRTPISSADYLVYGESDTDELGWTTKFVGDVTGDGTDDIFTTAMYDDDGGSNAGVGGVIAGGSLRSNDTLSSVATTLFTGDGAEDRFGYDTVGFDADNDGVNDLLVGEYQDDTNGAESGTLRIYFGRSRWASNYAPTDADQTVYGSAAGDRFAHILQDVGDVDGDSLDDLMIGALFADPDGRSLAGSAYLALGSDLLAASTADDLTWRRDGEVASDLFGDALAFGSGDVNGDGVNEIVVGAQGYDGGASGAGRVYLWFGKP
jgi:hypothetical protein